MWRSTSAGRAGVPDISPAPPGTVDGGNRDEDAYRALEPVFSVLTQEAVDAGWTEAEVIVAIVGFALDRAIEAAGPQAAEHFLAAMQVRLRQTRA